MLRIESVILTFINLSVAACTWSYEGTTITLALVNYTYHDERRDIVVEAGQIGKFALGHVGASFGHLVLADRTRDNYDTACSYTWLPASTMRSRQFVALMGAGDCSEEEKVELAVLNNASAVILYSRNPHAHLRKVNVNYPGLGIVWLTTEEGENLASVVRNGGDVIINITPGHQLRYHVTTVNRTSVLFVSVSFVILMAISLAWLIFYYIQRFRYIHAKDRLAKHLCNAAKKALTKIPIKTLRQTDRQVDSECCAVCLEVYQIGEVLRILPCKHEFHRGCVDPWLLQNRTCPMCKMDILKHYGYLLSESEESVLEFETPDSDNVTEREHSGLEPTEHTPQNTQAVVVVRGEAAGCKCGGRMEEELEEEQEEEEEEVLNIPVEVEEEGAESVNDRIRGLLSPTSQVVSVSHF